MAAIAGSSAYFSKKELTGVLETKTFDGQEGSIKDPWKAINSFRSMVSSALTQGLDDILLSKIKEGCPVIEIGSGQGYPLSEELAKRVVRTQPCHVESALLAKTISDPVYQLDVESLCQFLSEKEKKISLFFALNVFDAMSSEQRKANVLRLSALQEPEDKIVVLLDTNPYLNEILPRLAEQHPGHAVLPYIDPSHGCVKMSAVIVPLTFVERNPSSQEFFQMINKAALAWQQGGIPMVQHQLLCLQRTFNFKVIHLEDFFAEQMKSEFAEIGYEASSYYQAAFSVNSCSKLLISQDFAYKSVTDIGSVREWSFKDPHLLKSLGDKKITLPAHFAEAFFADVKQKGQVVQGAEFLVIEATKKGVEA